MNARVNLLFGLAVLGIGVGIGWLLARDPPSGSPGDNAAPAAGDVLYWYDPMRPEVQFDKPGPSPFMDMALVPKYRSSADDGGITINPRMAQNLGVRTAPAVEATVAPQVTVTGAVGIDERGLAVVTTRAAGWIERLDVRASGDRVTEGQRLAGIYSPDLLAGQEELLLALRTGDDALIPAARRRLELLGMSARQLDGIRRRGTPDRQVDIRAPAGGVVTELLVREGAAVTPGMPLMTLADLSRVWVIAAVPEAQGAWLRVGDSVDVAVTAPGSAPLVGQLDYLYPELSAETRTVRARIVLANDALVLRPGMAVRVTIRGDRRPAIVVPTAALIRSGERTAVILAEGDGQFRPVAVLAGAEQGEQTEIRSGLKAGDTVVVSGQFLIDSEANLRGALDRLLPGEQR
ncbi:MAG: efflux RND transporter periplasmic adaptor subunit [Gammaproteobacteria bacterium]|nr:efflux RND transporter periplasmic adaptor subunit [Gammaproteobacteria bacterium]